MTLEPMLAKDLSSVKRVDLSNYHGEAWIWEQKLDGVRMMVTCEDGKVWASNRRAVEVPLPRLPASLANLTGTWTFDGEYIDGVFWAFDLPQAAGLITLKTPYSHRRTALNIVFEDFVGEDDTMRRLPAAYSAAQKQELLARVQDQSGEGLMLKTSHGIYRPGVRSEDVLKLKFYKTLEAVVGKKWRQGKNSIGLVLFENGKAIDVGACTMTDRNLERVETGDVVEVKYLYATEDRRLYQPAFIRKREDKLLTECTIDQMQFTDKSVIVP